MVNSYLTLATANSAEHSIKKSRFIGHAAPVCSADEAMLFIQAIRQQHPDANHNVWAYALRGGLLRYSDDGEPQGTAGLPTLDVLQKQCLVDCVVVVTRYFGGIHLGAGGLVRAYSQSAKLAVDAAGIAEMALCAVVRTTLEYGLYGRAQNVISAMEGAVLDTQFGQEVMLELRVCAEEASRLIENITDACHGKVVCEVVREEFAAVRGA